MKAHPRTQTNLRTQSYLRWRADGRARRLDQLNPRLRQDERTASSTGTIEAPIEQPDLDMLMCVSETLSSELDLEKLIEKLMRAAIHYVGAERGFLIVPHGDELRIDAEANARGADVAVHVHERGGDVSVLPVSLLRYVMRTREIVILNDAYSSLAPFCNRARSILCLPLINHGMLVGILYLENDRTSRAFTSNRSTVLKVLASQAAIALENTRLYRDIADREARIRHLWDTNILGNCVWYLDGTVVSANEEFLRMLKYSHGDVVSGRLRWNELTPPEWREQDERVVAELRTTGTFQAFEKEFFCKDGSRTPVLIGGALFEESSNEVAAFVLDLTERKRAEQAFRELESDLAHMNRVSMMGELAASLAHEITQPIASARNNARAAQNFLDMQPPDLGEVREAVTCIVGDVDRAGDIIDRIREQMKRAPLRKECFDLNAAINEVIVLARSAILNNGVSVKAELANGLLAVDGDRVQLQQVVLNLILNAVEAMGSVEAGARELSICTEPDGTGVLVAVRDSGPGINSTHLERVFEAFYTTKSSGVGMGLSICRSIVDGHGGRLWAEANEPSGAVFQFTLPGVELRS